MRQSVKSGSVESPRSPRLSRASREPMSARTQARTVDAAAAAASDEKAILSIVFLESTSPRVYADISDVRP